MVWGVTFFESPARRAYFAIRSWMARGEVVVVDDKFGVRITELVSAGQNKGDV